MNVIALLLYNSCFRPSLHASEVDCFGEQYLSGITEHEHYHQPHTDPNTKSITQSLTHRAETFLRCCQLCSQSRTSQRFVELEGSLLCSQEPSTGPYLEPDRSNPYYPILSTRVEAGSNTSTVTLRVVRGDEMGLKKAAP
jgi:hypothetical protein